MNVVRRAAGQAALYAAETFHVPPWSEMSRRMNVPAHLEGCEVLVIPAAPDMPRAPGIQIGRSLYKGERGQEQGQIF